MEQQPSLWLHERSPKILTCPCPLTESQASTCPSTTTTIHYLTFVTCPYRSTQRAAPSLVSYLKISMNVVRDAFQDITTDVDPLDASQTPSHHSPAIPSLSSANRIFRVPHNGLEFHFHIRRVEFVSQPFEKWRESSRHGQEQDLGRSRLRFCPNVRNSVVESTTLRSVHMSPVLSCIS